MRIFIKDLNFITNWFYEPHTFEEIMSKWKPNCNTEEGRVYLLPILKCVHRSGKGFEKNTYTLAKEVAIVDKNVYEKVAKVPWRMHNAGYAVAKPTVLEKVGFSWASVPKGLILLHRIILDVVEDKTLLVDHVDGDKLDNRTTNLRMCNHSGNSTNVKSKKGSASKYRGVSWSKSGCKWRVRYKQDSKYVHVGVYDSEEEAAHARDSAIRAAFEDTSFHRFNFPEEGEQSALQEDDYDDD